MTDVPRSGDTPSSDARHAVPAQRREVASYCRICESLCGIVATVEDNRIVDIRGDGDHPVSRGYLCSKGKSMTRVIEDPDRVTTPLKRTGGPGEFAPTDWNQALGDVAERLTRIRNEYGPNAIAMYLGNPVAFSLGAMFWAKGMIDAIGSPHVYSVGPQDTFGRQAASHFLYDSPALFPIPDIPRTDFFLCVGANPLISHGSVLTLPRIKDEMQGVVTRGGRVVIVDPIKTMTARAFEHVAVRPGTDAWLLAAMLQVIFSENLHDAERLAQTARGSEELAAVVANCTPAVAALVTGVPAETIVDLATGFATASSACAYARVGVNRNPWATVTCFLLDALNIVTGNYDRAGGIVFGDAPIDFAELTSKFGMSSFGKHRTRVGGLGDLNGLLPWVLSEEMTQPGRDRVRALVVVAGNPVLSAPDGAALERALTQSDLVVSLDFYVNETNRHADYVLPVSAFLEREDFPGSFLGHMPKPWLQLTPAVIDPPQGVREDWEVLDEIVARMGLGGPFSQRSVRLVAAGLRKLGVVITPTMLLRALLRIGRSGWTIKKLRRYPHGVQDRLHVRVGDARKKVQHPNGLVNLAASPVLAEISRLSHERLDVPDGVLQLVGRRDALSINSWFHNVRRVRVVREPTLWLNPADAARFDISSEDRVAVSGPAGRIEVVAEISDLVPCGVVSYPHGWGHRGGWKTANSFGGQNINLLASSRIEDKDPLSGASHLDGILVTIARAATD